MVRVLVPLLASSLLTGLEALGFLGEVPLMLCLLIMGVNFPTLERARRRALTRVMAAPRGSGHPVFVSARLRPASARSSGPAPGPR